LQSNSKSPVTAGEPAPTTPSLEEPMPSSTVEGESKTEVNSHIDHSFWGDHAGHIYIFLGALFLIFAWKKYGK
jgi:hypothetical protein